MLAFTALRARVALPLLFLLTACGSEPEPQTSDLNTVLAANSFDDCWETQYHTAEQSISAGDTAFFGLKFGQSYDQHAVLDSLGKAGILRRDNLKSWVLPVDLGPTAIYLQPYLIQKDSIGLYAMTLKVNEIDLPPVGGVGRASHLIAWSLYKKWNLSTDWRACLSRRGVDYYWFRGPVEISIKAGEKHVEVNCVHVPKQESF